MTNSDQSGHWVQTDRIAFGPTLGILVTINEPINVTTATYTVSPFSQLQPLVNLGAILVNRNGTVTINLPPAAGRLGFPIPVFDIGGFAAANNITIVPSGSEKIMGLASISITANYGSYVLEPLQTGGWTTP